MDELNALLKPSWGAETWILEGWNKITAEEKALIKDRMDDLFKDGLPFELKHDKLLYIYTFSLLAQFEVLAIQVPLRFEEKMTTPAFKQSMRTQLLDEIFHGMVFTKIVYLLCAPYRSPPEYNEHIEALCNFIRQEECPKVGVVLLNLVAEGWIEEIFKSLYLKNIAPKIFEVILEDEHRHVCEADLYRTIGLPDINILKTKLAKLEELLMASLTMEPKYAISVSVLLGIQGTQNFLRSLNDKHTAQLKKINLTPSEQWQMLLHLANEAYEQYSPYSAKVEAEIYEVEMTPIRRVFMTQWDNPGDPTMVSQFYIDVGCLHFFEKKFPPETLTVLMMQTVSYLLTTDPSYRNFLSYKKMYQSRHAYVSVVVKLPGCGDHMGNIMFKDCHELSAQSLAEKIKQIVPLMVYCYKKREQIEKTSPTFKRDLDAILYGYAHDIYPYPAAGSSMVSVSNIGFCGYAQAVSPLRKHEGQKVTLLAVEKKPVWSNKTESFEPKDMLPVSISADHRIFDGNLPVPKMMSSAFQLMFKKMIEDLSASAKNTQKKEESVTVVFEEMLQEISDPAYASKKNLDSDTFESMVDKMLDKNLEMGYRLLSAMQNMYVDYIDLQEIFNQVSKKTAHSKLNAFMT